jgi:N-acetylmuramoyl-L-alanine amidase
MAFAWKDSMGIWNNHNSNWKAAILEGIYHDNLRIAGKRAHDARLGGQAHWYRKPASILLVVMAAALYPFSASDPSLSAKEVSPQMVQASASVENNAAVAVFGPDTTWHPGPLRSDPPVRQAALPDRDWDLSVPINDNFQDYSLLLSRSEPVRLFSLFGLDVKTIVIDAGHGGRDPGAIGAKGIEEKNITLDVAMRLKKRLCRAGNFIVLLTRDRDRTLSLAERVGFAKQHKADLFISVHVNSIPNHTLNAIETYYFGPPLNAETLQIAEQENKDSHYTIGQLDAIIQDIGNTVKRQESAMLAAAVQKSLLRNVRRHDAHVRDFGVRMAPFVVLSQVDIPSVLVEIACLTKKQEEAKLASAGYREKVASFMEEGIEAYLETRDTQLISEGD